MIKIHDIQSSLITNGSYRQRSLQSVDKIIVHHSATDTGTAVGFSRYHVEHNKWPGIGYHFVIDKQGQIQQTNSLRTRSYHTAGQNTKGVGICLIGNFDKYSPTTEQLESLVDLLIYLCKDVFSLTADAIKGHRDFSSKTCPGSRFDLEHLKAIVDANM